MSLLTKSKQPLNTKAAVFMISPLKLALGLTCGIVLSAQAQIVANNGANVTQAANGTDIININRAGEHGVSYNTFDQFNVSQLGAVLNNATSEVNSQLTGGTIAANSQLGDTAAQIIIAQVNQGDRNRSRLNGAVEVTGSAADVIIANPAGITCDGCGFINTNSVSLVAGQVALDDTGKIDGYIPSTRTKLEFTGQGLSQHAPNHLNLVASYISFNANVKLAEDSTLNVIATRNTLDSNFNTASNKRDWAYNRRVIDIALDSVLTADTITFRADSINQSLSNYGSITGKDIHFDKIGFRNIWGIATASDSLRITDGNLLNHGTINAGKEFIQTGGREAINSGSIIADSIDINTGRVTILGKMSSTTGLTITANNLSNYGLIASEEGDIELTVGNIRNYRQISSGGDITLAAYTLNNDYLGLIESIGDMKLTVDNIRNYSQIVSRGDITFDTYLLNNHGYGKIVADKEINGRIRHSMQITHIWNKASLNSKSDAVNLIYKNTILTSNQQLENNVQVNRPNWGWGWGWIWW